MPYDAKPENSSLLASRGLSAITILSINEKKVAAFDGLHEGLAVASYKIIRGPDYSIAF